jgi:hypothetical protein
MLATAAILSGRLWHADLLAPLLGLSAGALFGLQVAALAGPNVGRI